MKTVLRFDVGEMCIVFHLSSLISSVSLFLFSADQNAPSARTAARSGTPGSVPRAGTNSNIQSKSVQNDAELCIRSTTSRAA